MSDAVCQYCLTIEIKKMEDHCECDCCDMTLQGGQTPKHPYIWTIRGWDRLSGEGTFVEDIPVHKFHRERPRVRTEEAMSNLPQFYMVI